MSVETKPKSPSNYVKAIIYYFIVTYFNIFNYYNYNCAINPLTPVIIIRFGLTKRICLIPEIITLFLGPIRVYFIYLRLISLISPFFEATKHEISKGSNKDILNSLTLFDFATL